MRLPKFLVIFIFKKNSINLLIFILNLIFSKAFDAKVSVLILWIGTTINFYNYLPTPVLKYLLCIFPNMGLQFGFQVIFQYERSG